MLVASKAYYQSHRISTTVALNYRTTESSRGISCPLFLSVEAKILGTGTDKDYELIREAVERQRKFELLRRLRNQVT